ncbi:MAG: histidinol-phosphatase HisJ family protein [Lachnospiraceae bacterium]|nr:histidinol-phosphatase HisJ family protein [Lachnospiraceae bacterium]
MLSDFHLHSQFSGDSVANPEEIINNAISKGMKHICFTDHLDIDYPEDDCDFDLDTDSYYSYILSLKNKYKDKIDIMTGMETGLQPHIASELDNRIKKHDFDFIIGSSHIVNGMDPYYKKFFEGRSNYDAYMEYFISIKDCLKSCKNFDVYGHIDYVIRYTPYKDQPFSYNGFSDIIDEILKDLIYNGKGIELNTGGYAAGLNCPNPCPDIIRRYKELGGEIITVGSDAHKAENVGGYFENAERVLKECGFDYYTIFKKRRPLFVKLDIK